MSGVALFGGSFDPPHRGHLAVALAAARAFELDQLLFVPTGLQPLKPEGATASFADRVAMTELLCAEAKREAAQQKPILKTQFSVSLLDAPQQDDAPNYTIATLRKLRANLDADLGEATQLFVVVGADSFLDLRRWREPDALLAAAEWIVVSRPGFALANLTPLSLTRAQLARVHLLEEVSEPASATQVRSALVQSNDESAFITAPVLDYIHTHHLYGA